jgi:uncharacterized protein with FMN-binding domain
VKRAPIVITSTAAGLALVLSFHTSPPSSGVKTATGDTNGGKSRHPTASTSTTTGSTSATTGSTSTTTEPTGTDSARTATGSDIQYRYGDIQLEVTASGSKITDISIVKDGSDDGHSFQINSQAVPILQSESLSAQSAQIDGVSGATYTSAAYVQSLQSALDKLGIQ